MASKKIKGAFPAILTSQEEYQDLLKRNNIRCLVDHENNQIYGYAALVDGETYTAGPELAEAKTGNVDMVQQLLGRIVELEARTHGNQSSGPSQPERLAKEIEKVWSSVLKLRPADGGKGVQDDVSTALVYDIFLEEQEGKEETSGYMLLLANQHSKLTNGESYELLYSDQDDYYEVLKFKMQPSLFWLKPDKAHDVQILKIWLDDKIWDVYPGQAVRKAPEPCARPKRKASERKLANILCKTPRLTYTRIEGQEVRVFGYPNATANRFMATSHITSIERDTFHLQSLSGPGLSGGAVVTSSDGLYLIGYMDGGLNIDDEGTPFGSYAYDVRSLPARPSSWNVERLTKPKSLTPIFSS